jgi:hypothetical protein
MGSPNSLGMIDVKHGSNTSTRVNLGKDDVVAGLALAKDGSFYLVTKNALWSWVPAEARVTWLEGAPKNVNFDDVACNPRTDEVLVTSGPDLYYKSNRRTGVTAVNIRYPPGKKIESPTFLPDNSFIFSADGDLWHGFIEYAAKEPGSTNQCAKAALVAYRYAPLATRETYDGTPSETGIRAIAVSRKKVYVDFGRMEGSGWGRVVRMELPVQEPGTWASHNGADETVKTLGSVEDLGCIHGGHVYLCGSPDGCRVYFGDGCGDARPHPRSFWIINDGTIQSANADHSTKGAGR